MDTVLIKINKLLYPYILGYWSENNGGGVIVTNTSCTQMRGFGARKWSPFVEAPISSYNTRLEPAIENHLSDEVLKSFLNKERIVNVEMALQIQELVKPYFLALHGDLQGQYHYCLTAKDPMTTTGKQKVAYLFPGTQYDLYDFVPDTDDAWASPMVGGSLGWLAGLDSEKTIAGITTAKKRLA
ncbi:TPA: hypothetical protein DIU27_00695 [Candidatus Collierbacteria bacterium]|uniref:Uncharacterized protein n=1 Tax=Candidatus Collierbacteria bacterium GW2011_GWB2_44_22 TaxID=1618387 RepID=A0A0G1HVD9_9BACT|nr:MAG: hypothetical protein UW31_C0019G0006 [Candidatus Collierbacteria bacterium GW2011_GWA2_44_13]KKT50935.1 MAG: hypothetical protein UW44_C0022G0011 [Candidatus Collierbacteria bacterium GW2011_GWB2_44_22]KKT67937.1 MAG: hypothetical protein UW64_C0034G0011 [Microgenomates group bacterium GW2011_GWC1_44_37]HCQ30887.1 hypothetical protein [Candidatus Collierbacteria bacterium]